MKLKNIVASILATAVLSQAAPALAAGVDDFTDVPADYWGREALAYCVDNGYMQGVGENKMDPEGTLTLAEFVTMLQRIVLTDEERDKILQFLSNAGGTLDSHWAAESMFLAEQSKITQGIHTSKSLWDEPVSRATMAVLVDNIMRIQGQPIPNTDYIYSKIPDWSSIQGRQESTSILRVYTDGIIIGVDGNGTFNPESTVTRAVAATIALRIQDPSTRKPISNSSSTTTPTETPSEGIFAPQTIHEGQGAKDRSPQPGDTYVAADGTTITLQFDPLTGVLGWGQYDGFMDYWSNGSCDDGHQLRGEGSMTYYTIDGIQRGGILIKGQQGMFTKVQWLDIQKATKPSQPGTKDGQKDSTGLWYWAASVNQWAWGGPLV